MNRIIALLVATVALTACKQQEPVAEEIRPVRTLVVGQAQGGGVLEFSGEIRARYETVLGFRVGGKIINRLVDVGSVVRAGQPLARLDPQDVALNVAAAKAQTDAASADLAQLKLNLKRAEDLFAKKFVSQAEVDRSQTAVIAAQSKLEQAQAQQRLTLNQAGYSTLLADSGGVVTSVDAEAGQVVAAGQPVVRIARDGEREVVIDVAENQRAAIKPGQAAVVTLWAQPDKVLAGKVREIAPAADSLARTYRVRVALAASTEPISLGMSATVKLDAGLQTAAMNVPLSAVFGSGSAHRVWLFDPASGQVKTVAVSIIATEGENLRLSGLKKGDIVVTAGVHLLRGGQKVRQINVASPAGN